MRENRIAAGTGESSVDWYREIGEIIGELGSERLPERLIGGLRRLVPFDLAAIFVYRGRSRPLPIYDDFEPAAFKKGIAAYVESTYVLNPFYQAYLKGIRPGVYRIRDLAPDAFFESEYYRSHRVSPRPTEEIGYVTENWPEGMEEVEIVVGLEGETVAEICLLRRLRGRGFSDRELDRFSTVQPVVGALLRKYWAELSTVGSGAPLPDSRVDDAFASFGKSVLTERECEVVRLILRGHSSESIGYNLRISLGTVKTHRRNAYAKLGICSQSEVLSLFLRSLQMSEPRSPPSP